MRSISADSVPLRPSGFVQTIALPAAAAARTASTCMWFGSATTTMSTCGSAQTSSIVAIGRLPKRAAKASRRSSPAP